MENETTEKSAPIPIVDMATEDLIREENAKARRRTLKWVGLSILVIIAVAVGAIVFWGVRVTWALHKHFAQLNADGAEMQRPENFKPAELYLARMMQSDPGLWKSELDEPPDWLPPELGKLNAHVCDVSSDGCAIGGGGGFDDFFGYHLDRDSETSTDSRSGFVLTYLGQGPDRVLDRFTISKTDHLDEDEVVKSALAELARRQTAYANGSRPNLYGDDPVADRKRLLSQHPTIAAKLGYSIPATVPSTSPFSLQLQATK
jgi:hypothetical protein